MQTFAGEEPIAIYRSKAYPTTKRAEDALDIFRGNMNALFELARKENL